MNDYPDIDLDYPDPYIPTPKFTHDIICGFFVQIYQQTHHKEFFSNQPLTVFGEKFDLLRELFGGRGLNNSL